jgi:thioredoxin reductase (NADPH)
MPKSTACFVLISRGYCHLCDEMREALALLVDGFTIDLKIVDVDANTDLLAKYDELVPVLLDAQGLELCHYHLDSVKVLEYLGRFG